MADGPRRHPILRGMVFVALAAAALIAVVALVTLLAGQRPMFGKTLAIVDVRGVIQDASETIDTLERLRQADSTVAVVLRIDSPGGSVAPSQEIYDEVWRVREQKPVIASLGSVAASGGYYIASAANRILADPGTITGSIGAIMTVPYYAPLADKIGFSEENVKSGRFKDTGHPLRRLSPDERTLLQNVVDDVLGQFVDAVARGRRQPAARIRALADGRIYSGSQALAVGLVDQLGGLHEATEAAWKDAGQSGEPRVQRLHGRRLPWFLQLLGDAFTDVTPASRGGLFFLYQGSHLE